MRNAVITGLAILLIGCGVNREGELSEDDKIKLTQLNELQMANNMAFDALGFHALDESLVSAKAAELAQRLRDCDRDGTRPQVRFDRNNQQEMRVDGAGCPVVLQQTHRYRTDEKQWFVYEKLSVRDQSYAAASGIRGRTLSGTANRLAGMGANYEVKGAFAISGFATMAFGDVRADITTSQQQNDGNSAGMVEMILKSSEGWSYRATITWSGSFSPKFEANGSEIDRAEFLRMFSSYGLVEIMDNGARMR